MMIGGSLASRGQVFRRINLGDLAELPWSLNDLAWYLHSLYDRNIEGLEKLGHHDAIISGFRGRKSVV